MIAETRPTFATRADLDAHIEGQGHELVWMVLLDGGTPWVACGTCGAALIETADGGVDVDEHLLGPCVEPAWVSYAFKEGE